MAANLRALGRRATQVATNGDLAARLWPRACLLCDQACGNAALCCYCEEALSGANRSRCPVCAAPWLPTGTGCPDCARLQPVLAATVAAADYCAPLAEAIASFKFAGQPGLAGGFGRLLAAAIARALQAGRYSCAQRSALIAIDHLVPIPLAPNRLAERGFNQSEAIARQLRRAWARTLLAGDTSVRSSQRRDDERVPNGTPPTLAPEMLHRIRDTPHQTKLGSEQRLRNLSAGFTASARASGRRIALIDDVMTTGATLDAAARALYAVGAVSVAAFVVARTP